MPATASFITHHVRPGQRDAVRVIWQERMAPAVRANPGHEAYQAYEREVAPLLVGPPNIKTLVPVWSKTTDVQ